MTPLEIALLASSGYMSMDLITARFAYRNFNWESFNTDTENVVFSCLFGFIWPILLLMAAIGTFVAAPTKAEKRAERVKVAEKERAERAMRISRMERELGIGSAPVEIPRLAAKPTPMAAVIRTVQAAVGYTPKAPDQRCALCFVGGPPPGHGCPFYPVCQKS